MVMSHIGCERILFADTIVFWDGSGTRTLASYWYFLDFVVV
jgi:hypothetical protein